jgi:hypothetical protein
LIPRIDAYCLRCGWAFHWNIREKDIQGMTLAYDWLLCRDGYIPE